MDRPLVVPASPPVRLSCSSGARKSIEGVEAPYGVTTYTGAIPLTQSTHLKARVWNSGKWSALHEATYEVAAKN